MTKTNDKSGTHIVTEQSITSGITESNGCNCSYNISLYPFTDWKCESCKHLKGKICPTCGHGENYRCGKHDDMPVALDFMCADWMDVSGRRFERPQPIQYTPTPYNPAPLPSWPEYQIYPTWNVTINDAKKE